MKLKLVAMLLAVCLVCSGCVATMNPLVGNIYANVSGPLHGPTTNPIGSKRGESTATLILGFSSGDSSVETAAKNGGITKIATVDQKITQIFFVYAVVTTVVTGE